MTTFKRTIKSKKRTAKNHRKHNGTEKITSRLLKYCPHMSVHNGKYASITKSRPHILKWKGKKYKFYTCCRMCCKQMLALLKNNPRKFEKMYIDKIEKNKMYLKHKDTGKLVQIATLVSNTHTKKHKGGNGMVYGTGYGQNCNDPNHSIYNTNMLKLFPYNVSPFKHPLPNY